MKKKTKILISIIVIAAVVCCAAFLIIEKKSLTYQSEEITVSSISENSLKKYQSIYSSGEGIAYKNNDVKFTSDNCDDYREIKVIFEVKNNSSKSVTYNKIYPSENNDFIILGVENVAPDKMDPGETTNVERTFLVYKANLTDEQLKEKLKTVQFNGEYNLGGRTLDTVIKTKNSDTSFELISAESDYKPTGLDENNSSIETSSQTDFTTTTAAQ